jgi:hypothetical protein
MGCPNSCFDRFLRNKKALFYKAFFLGSICLTPGAGTGLRSNQGTEVKPWKGSGKSLIPMIPLIADTRLQMFLFLHDRRDLVEDSLLVGIIILFPHSKVSMTGNATKAWAEEACGEFDGFGGRGKGVKICLRRQY